MHNQKLKDCPDLLMKSPAWEFLLLIGFQHQTHLFGLFRGEFRGRESRCVLT